MSGRTQFWLGSLMLALAMGLLVGSFILPSPTYGQQSRGEGRAGRYALVTGIAGVTQKSQTLYVVDDANELLFVFEYSARSREIAFREATDMRRYASQAIKMRAKREEKVERRRP